MTIPLILLLFCLLTHCGYAKIWDGMFDNTWCEIIIVMCFLTASFIHEKNREKAAEGEQKVKFQRLGFLCRTFIFYHHVRLLTFISHVCFAARAFSF